VFRSILTRLALLTAFAFAQTLPAAHATDASTDPTEHAAVKPRLPQGAVLHREQYDAAAADAHIVTYNERLSTYNTRFGLPGNWSDRVLERLKGPESMAGRHRLRETLERLGLPSR